MTPSSHRLRPLTLAFLSLALPLGVTSAAESIKLIFQNGRSLPLSAISVQGETITVTGQAESFAPGQTFPLAAIDHIFGDKPAELNPGIALLLMEKPAEALNLLEPLVAAQRATAKIPGNFWLEAAQAALVAYATQGNTAKCSEIGKEISDATPAQGIDPFVSLGKALLLPPTTSAKDREVALSDLLTNNMPADVSAYASFFLGKLYAATKREPQALESYLSVPSIYPSGGLILNAVAELKAGEMLQALSRREEAVALFTSSTLHAPGTIVAVEANKRLESSK
jgi:tetratricopeptide (TPR) repeat protein